MVALRHFTERQKSHAACYLCGLQSLCIRTSLSICICVSPKTWDLSSHRADRMRQMVPRVSVAVLNYRFIRRPARHLKDMAPAGRLPL